MTNRILLNLKPSLETYVEVSQDEYVVLRQIDEFGVEHYVCLSVDQFSQITAASKKIIDQVVNEKEKDEVICYSYSPRFEGAK